VIGPRLRDHERTEFTTAARPDDDVESSALISHDGRSGTIRAIEVALTLF
jgi:hypothetical protein